MHPLSMLADEFLGEPVALRREARPALEAVLACIHREEALAPAELPGQPERAYDVIEGVAIVPVQGLLTRCTTWWSDYLGMTGYDAIAAYARDAAADPDIRAIAFHVNSPGGPSSGCLELAAVIHDLRGIKPMWAILDDGAYSAAYGAICGVDRITAPPSGGAGSIGVIGIYPDYSDMLKQIGIGMKMLSFGAAKTDSYPYAAMSDDAEKRLQYRIDQLGGMFCDTVGLYRGIDPASVRATQANCLLAKDALAARLIDAIATPEEAFAALLSSL